MFLNKNRVDFEVSNAKYSENLVDVIKRAGYDIIWLENDDGCKNVCKRIETEYMVKQNNKK